MKDCSKYHELTELLPHLDTSEPQFAPLLDHFQECPACLERYLLSKEIDGYIKEGIAEVMVPPSLLDNLPFIKTSGKRKPS